MLDGRTYPQCLFRASIADPCERGCLFFLHHGQAKWTAQWDETWAEFSILDARVLVYAIQFQSKQKQPNLKLKTRPKQLCTLPLAFPLLGLT